MAARFRLQSTSGGSSETAVNEFAVRPSRFLSAVSVVTTVMPVAKRPSAWRSSRGSRAVALATSFMLLPLRSCVLPAACARDARAPAEPVPLAIRRRAEPASGPA